MPAPGTAGAGCRPAFWGISKPRSSYISPPLISGSRRSRSRSAAAPPKTAAHLPEKWRRSRSRHPVPLRIRPSSSSLLRETYGSHPFLCFRICSGPAGGSRCGNQRGGGQRRPTFARRRRRACYLPSGAADGCRSEKNRRPAIPAGRLSLTALCFTFSFPARRAAASAPHGAADSLHAGWGGSSPPPVPPEQRSRPPWCGCSR